MTNKEVIQKYMDKLGLTEAEAKQLWQDEQEDNLPELTMEQKQVEKQMRQADRKKEAVPRKRERKPDNDKRFLISALEWVLTTDIEQDGDNVNADDVVVTNPEREIEFTYNGNRYRLTLAKPRKNSNEA